METFKVGDLVKVKENISSETYFTTCNFVKGMLKYRGRITRIKEIHSSLHCEELYVNYSLVDIENYIFDPEMLEPIPEYSITSNNSPLITEGLKAVSSLPEITITQTIPKFKVGDKVIIKDDLIIYSVYNGWCLFTESMKKYCGKSTIVNSITTLSSSNDVGYYLDNIHDIIFSNDMLELVEEPSIKLKDSETLKLFL